MENKISIKNEFLRKIIHLSNSGIAFMLLVWSQMTVIYFVIILTIIILGVDLFRIYNNKVALFYYKILGNVTRDFERKKLTGASYVMLASLITLLLFDKYICIASLLIMSYSDTSAALIGRVYGKTKIYEKTLEGSLAFFVTSLLIILCIVPKIDFLFALIAIIVATLVELFSVFKIDDNLSVPIIAAVIMSLGG